MEDYLDFFFVSVGVCCMGPVTIGSAVLPPKKFRFYLNFKCSCQAWFVHYSLVYPSGGWVLDLMLRFSPG